MQVAILYNVDLLGELSNIKVVYNDDRQDVHSLRDYRHAPKTLGELIILIY